MTDAERFMQHYMEVWPSFDADRLDEAIDPEATIHHSGMERAIDAIGRWDNLELLAQIDPTVSATAFAEAAASLVAEESSRA